MLKLFYRAKRFKQEKKDTAAPIYTAFLSLALCMVCLAGTTWAWFTANQEMPIEPIIAAQYGISVSIEGEGCTEGQPEGNMRFYSLAPNQSYSVTLTPAADTTASTGYCLVAVDDAVYYTSPITAETNFTFTYQTGVAVPDGLTKAEYDELVSEAEGTSLTVAWYWGTYPNTQDLVTFETDPGYMPLKNGAVLGIAPAEAPMDAELTLELTDFDLPNETEKLIPLCEDYELVLIPNEGYELPEVVTVEIDEEIYEVYTDGLEHREIPVDEEGNPDPKYLNEDGEPDLSLLPPMPTFDPWSSTLTIPAILLPEDIRAVTIMAAAVEIEEPECNCETECTSLNGDCPVCKDNLNGCMGTPVEEPTAPTDETDPTDVTDPTEAPDPTDATDPTAATDPTDPAETIATEPPVTTEPVSTDPPETTAAAEETTVTEPPMTDPPGASEPTASGEEATDPTEE